MKIASFIKSMLPTIGKESVVDDLRLTKAEFVEHTIPAYNAALDMFKSWKFKSDVLEKNFDIFDRMVEKDSRSDNFVVTIHKSFKNILENITHVEGMVDKTFNEEIASTGLTFKNASVLQYAEACAFVSKFARKYLVYIYICESSVYDSETAISDSLSPIEIQWLNSNFVSFCTAFNVVSGKPQMVEKQFSTIPDIIVTNDNIHTVEATMGASKVDPFRLAIIPIWMNPIYHIGMFVAEWQASRYKAAKEEVKLLQLRKINLQKLHEGKPDARVQQEIRYMEGRIQSLNFKIAKLEKDASIT